MYLAVVLRVTPEAPRRSPMSADSAERTGWEEWRCRRRPCAWWSRWRSGQGREHPCSRCSTWHSAWRSSPRCPTRCWRRSHWGRRTGCWRSRCWACCRCRSTTRTWHDTFGGRKGSTWCWRHRSCAGLPAASTGFDPRGSRSPTPPSARAVGRLHYTHTHTHTVPDQGEC